MAPVARALIALAIDPLLVLTGQQAVEPAHFGLPGFDRLELGCRGLADPDAHVRRVAAALRRHLVRCPRLLVVQGDTSSAWGAAQAAFEAGISVAHVEAGLRTHDLAQPWPEEGYRVAIDAAAELLFAPSAGAACNLAAEAVPGTVHVTGNSGIDALLQVTSSLPSPSLHERRRPRLLVTCHRRESWGTGLQSIASALGELAGSGEAQIDVILHPNAHVAATMGELLGGVRGIRLLRPCSHAELVQRMRAANLILSDSGGIQEEAPALGIPLLVLREKTERPEVIASGNARLVGTATETIVAKARALLRDPAALAAMSRPAFPYGTGSAGRRIAAIVGEWLALKERRPPALVLPSERLGAGR
jgi:UDP-N-acetylglucosamine 2-epimerase (non-hydrolysing)